MRIAVWHNLPSGGGKRALYQHVSGLVARGHDVEAWCPSSADQSYLPLSQLCIEHVLPLDEAAATKNATRSIFRRRRSETTRLLNIMERHCAECAAQISEGSFDVVLGNSCKFFATNPIARYLRIPSILYLQEPYRLLYEALPLPPWALNSANGNSGVRSARAWFRETFRIEDMRLQVREETKNAAAFDRILVNSLFSRESVLRAYGLESHVSYLGIDTEHFQSTGETSEGYAMGLGGLHFNKGVDRAIRALAEIPAAKRPRLIWVANFSHPCEEEPTCKLANSLGVHFELKVRVSDGELISLLSRAALLLYTSRLEPFGYAPLEANACGTPVVAVAEGGIRETVQNGINGLVVHGADPKALAQAIMRVMEDKPLAAKLRTQAVDYVRSEWTLSAAIDRLEGHLRASTRLA